MILDDGWFSWWWMMVDFHDGWWSTIITSWIYLLSTPLYILYISTIINQVGVFTCNHDISTIIYINHYIYIYQLYITSFFCCYFDISPRKRWFWGSGSRTVAVSCMSLLATTGSLGKIRYKPRILEEYSIYIIQITYYIYKYILCLCIYIYAIYIYIHTYYIYIHILGRRNNCFSLACLWVMFLLTNWQTQR
jgi:hypothetical protein